MLGVGLLQEETAIGNRGNDYADSCDEQCGKKGKNVCRSCDRRQCEQRESCPGDDGSDENSAALGDPTRATHAAHDQSRDDARKKIGNLHQGEGETRQVVRVLEEVAEGQQQHSGTEVVDQADQDCSDEDRLTEQPYGEEPVLTLASLPDGEDAEDDDAYGDRDHREWSGDAVGRMRDAIKEGDDSDSQEELTGDIPRPGGCRSWAVLR